MSIPPEHHFEIFLFEAQEEAAREKLSSVVVQAVETIFSLVREKEFDLERASRKVRHELYRSIFVLEDDSIDDPDHEKVFCLAERVECEKEDLSLRVTNVVIPFIQLNFKEAVDNTNKLYTWLISKYENWSEPEEVPDIEEILDSAKPLKLSAPKPLNIKSEPANPIEGKIVNVKTSRVVKTRNTRSKFEKQVIRKEDDEGVIIRRVVASKNKSEADKKKSSKTIQKGKNTEKKSKRY